MGKTCLNKLVLGVRTLCEVPINGVKDLYLMHAEDVKTTLAADGNVISVEFAPATNSYRIEGYKQNIQVTSAIRALDASAKVDFSVVFKIHSVVDGAAAYLGTEKVLLNKKFYALVVLNSSAAYFIGDISPLECSGLEYDSNSNGGLVTITLAAPDGSAGNYRRGIASDSLATIISKSV